MFCLALKRIKIGNTSLLCALHGRQPNSDVFVVGPELQFYSTGSPIPPDLQQYIWIPEILCKLHIDKILAPVSTIPHITNPLKKLMKGMARVSGDNFIGSLCMLSKLHDCLLLTSICQPLRLTTLKTMGAQCSYSVRSWQSTKR